MQRVQTSNRVKDEKCRDEAPKGSQLSRLASAIAQTFKKRKKKAEKTIYPLF